VRIASSVVDAVVAHANESQPRECCGVLLGKADGITQAIRATNLAESSTRFLLDPKAHIEARRTARTQGLEVVGFYHSHPHSRAYPSASDLAEAAYPECVHLIVGFVEGEAEVRLFKYVDGTATELSHAILNSEF
jgi:[CysO sulfur-carrier protein]-S-L-cysteine hydrolase